MDKQVLKANMKELKHYHNHNASLAFANHCLALALSLYVAQTLKFIMPSMKHQVHERYQLAGPLRSSYNVLHSRRLRKSFISNMFQWHLAHLTHLIRLIHSFRLL